MFSCCNSKSSKTRKCKKNERTVPQIIIINENEPKESATQSYCRTQIKNNDIEEINHSSESLRDTPKSHENYPNFNDCNHSLSNRAIKSEKHDLNMIIYDNKDLNTQFKDKGCVKYEPEVSVSKSCISPHKGSNLSIKKRVNISSFAEIIEDDPIPIPIVDPVSTVEDDEVFSDSLPPSKRESLCAPYVQLNDDVLESSIFIHGLPNWFNDELMTNIGNREPPVTPVGRDELELRRQRLYSDLLQAAFAAVGHSIECRKPGHTFPVQGYSRRIGDSVSDVNDTQLTRFENLCIRLDNIVDRLEKKVFELEFSIADKKAGINFLGIKEHFESGTEHFSEVQVSNIVSERQPNHQTVKKKQTHCDLKFINETMSVSGYENIVDGPLKQYLSLSSKIGGDVAKHAELVKSAFDVQLDYIKLSTKIGCPNQQEQLEFLKPTSTQISAIQDYREKHRASPYFNHLSAISESIPALGWVCVSPTPGPHVKEMNDAGQFYTNRVLKEWKDKDTTHVEWARAWIQTLTELQAYIKQHHTTGLVWSGKGKASMGVAPPPPSIGSCPPPPPPPTFDLNAMSLESSSGDERSALFAEINQGEGITKNLKKVTAEMQTHKNPTLRTGPAPFKKPIQYGTQAGSASNVVTKAPSFTRDGKKWLIEYQKNNPNLIVENAEMNNVIYMFKCEGSTLTVKGKVNNIVMDSCKKCSLLFDSVVASIEFVNCQSVQMQVLGFVPTISIDKTDGCQMYLSKDSMQVEIVSSKSSEMNVMLPESNGDFNELAVPEQFKTTIFGKTLKTVCVDSLG